MSGSEGEITDADREEAQRVRDELELNDQIRLRGANSQAPTGDSVQSIGDSGRHTKKPNSQS